MKKHILVVTYWPFSEGLIQAYTIPYLKIIRKVSGAQVTLLTLEKQELLPQTIDEGITHLPVKADFFKPSMIFRWRKIIRSLKKFCADQHVTALHSWCTPGGAIAWLLSRATGLPIIADSYEPHADAMVENGTWKKGSLRFRLLFYMEKKLTFRAKELIGVSPYMKAYAEKRYGLKNKTIHVKPACTDLVRFSPSSDPLVATDGTITGVYAGKLGGIYYEHEVFEFIKACSRHWGGKFRFTLLGNYKEEYIAAMCRETGADRSIITHKAVPHEEVPGILAGATFGFTPVKPVPTKKCCTPIKDGEYWACGLPVIITKNISVDSDLVEQNKCGVVLQGTNEKDYENALSELDILLANGQEALKERCRSLAVTHRNFIIAEEIYRKIYS